MAWRGVSFPENVPRLTDNGLLIEEARTNIILNSRKPELVIGNFTLANTGQRDQTRRLLLTALTQPQSSGTSW